MSLHLACQAVHYKYSNKQLKGYNPRMNVADFITISFTIGYAFYRNLKQILKNKMAALSTDYDSFNRIKLL